MPLALQVNCPRALGNIIQINDQHVVMTEGRTASSIAGLTSEHIDPVDAKLPRCVLLRRRAKTVEPGGHAHVFKPDSFQVIDELCLRQSACDSAGPEIDVTAGFFWKFDIQNDISQVKPAAGS